MSASRSIQGATSAIRRSLGQITPTGASRSVRSRASARKRAAVSSTGTPSGSGASSSTRTYWSSTILPALTSGINTLPEWLDAGAFHGIDEQFIRPRAELDISGGDILDHIGDLHVRHRRADQRTELSVFVGLATERDLIKLLAVLLDAENADMADMVVAAGIDAAGNIDVQTAQIAREIGLVEAPGDFLRNRDRARIGETAIIEARTGDDVGDEPDIRDGKADRIERAIKFRQVALRDVRQNEILLVTDADLAERITIGEICNRVHLLGGGIARRAAFRLQRYGHDRIARHFMIGDRIAHP